MVGLLRPPLKNLVNLRSGQPKRDLFEIMLQDLEHWIHRPETLYVDEGPKGMAALEIIDAAGMRHRLVISRPIKVPSMTINY